MNVKIVLTSIAFASTLALAAPTLAQDKDQQTDQTMAAPKHHNPGVREARGKPRNHMARTGRHRRGAGGDVEARERAETARLNQEQLHSPGAGPGPAMHGNM